MSNYVPGVGPLDASIVALGEAPGSREDELKQPFVGPAGELLDSFLRGAGLLRPQIRIDNLRPYRPPDNNLKRIPKDEIAYWTEDLHQRIADLRNPVVVVPQGNWALNALLGLDRITKRRGSIYKYIDRKNRQLKVIPTIHPAAVFRQPSIERRIRIDWQRIASDSKFHDLNIPERRYIIHPSKAVIKDWVRECLDHSMDEDFTLVCDIETPKDKMVCVGFSWREDEAISIPVDDKEYWPNSHDRQWALGIVKYLLEELPGAKGFQNGLFDNFWLRMYGVNTQRWVWDTLCLHHCLDSTDEHSLGYMASIDLRHQYHKDDVHAELKGKGVIRNWDTFWQYNATDAAVTQDLLKLYRARVRERGQEQFYFDHYTATFQPLLDMMLNGVMMDDKKRRRKLADLMIHYLDIQEELQEMAGFALHAKKTLSTAKIKKYLYTTLGLPKMINRATGEPTTKEVALRRLLIRLTNRIKQQQFQLHSDGLDRPLMRESTRLRTIEDIAKGQQGVKALNLILDHRRTYQLSLFLPETRLDDDSKMRTQFGYSTETGRLTSSKSPMRTGGNLQNQDREIRHIFMPDPGYIFLEIDLSQVEWRIMTMFTHDEGLMELGRSKPWEFDIHNYNGGIIFSVDDDKVSKSQRYLAKRTVHGTSYGMTGIKLSELLLLDGIIRDPVECQAMLDTYVGRFPAIRTWQDRVAAKVRETRTLTNSWGRTINFKWDKLGDDLYRRAYAFGPQSENAGLLNQYGLIPAYHYIKRNRVDAHLNAQVHDSLLLSVRPDSYELCKFICESLERVREYEGEPLSVPATPKLGISWAGDVEFKKFPTKREYEEVAYGLHGKLYKEAA